MGAGHAAVLVVALCLTTTSPLRALAPSPAHGHVPGPWRAQTDVPAARLDGTWRRYTSVNAPLVSDAVRDVEVDGDGTVWLRVAETGDAPDQVVAVRADGRWRAYTDLRSAVEDRYGHIVELGALADFWAVDGAGRVWIGPEHYAGRWRRLVANDGPLTYGTRALVDAAGTAWVPFGTCPRPDTCGVDGMAAFSAEAPLDRLVRFESAPEAGQYGLADVHLVPYPDGTGATSRAAWAVSRRKLYVLPDETPVAYPLLGLDPPPAPRNAGYATAATVRPDGRLVIFTWVEIHDDRDVYHRVLGNPWVDGGWSASDDLTGAPVFPGDVEYVRVVAASYDPAIVARGSEVLWIATSSGEIAARRDGVWIARFAAADMGLPRSPAIRDLAVAPDGTVWVATDQGALAFQRRSGRARTADLPWIAQSRGR